MKYEDGHKATKYRKSEAYVQHLRNRSGDDKEGDTRLIITCWLGHQLAHIVKYPGASQFQFNTLWRIGDIFDTKAKEKEKLATQAAKRNHDQYQLFLTELSNQYPEQNEIIEAVGIGTGAPKQLDPDSSELARVTPDGKGLAWACIACFKTGLSWTTSRAKARRHTGRLKLWNLAAIAAGLKEGQKETVIGADARAKRLAIEKYDALNPNSQRQTAKIMAILAQYAKAQESYERWEKNNLVISNMSLKDKNRRYKRNI